MQPSKGKAPKAAPTTAEEKQLLQLAQHLLSSVPTTDRGLIREHGAPIKVRVFRAEKMIDYMVNPANKKCGLDKVTTRDEAVELCQKLLAFDKPRLFVKCDRIVKQGTTNSEKAAGLRLVRVDPRSAKFETGEESRYVWLYEGDTTWNNVKLALLVVGIIALCMFQLWPPVMRVAVWYVAVTLLLAMVAVTILQLVTFGLAWMAGWELWILPNLWSDTAMIWEIFTPVYTLEKAGGSAWYWRVGLALALAGSGYWLSTQPTELEKFMATNKQFVDDLYAGNLLSDGSGPGSGLTTGRASYSSYGGPFGGPNKYGQRPAHIPRFEDIVEMTSEQEQAKQQQEEEAKEGEAGAGEAGSGGHDVEPEAEAPVDMDAILAQEDEAQAHASLDGEGMHIDPQAKQAAEVAVDGE